MKKAPSDVASDWGLYMESLSDKSCSRITGATNTSPAVLSSLKNLRTPRFWVSGDIMSSHFVLRKVLCVELNCENWFIDCLCKLYGLRELGHSGGGLYLIEDVKASLIAHAADGRPTKGEMEKRIKEKGVVDEAD